MEIDTNEVYKQLKKQNGEHFAKVIREYNLLDLQNILHIVEFAGKTPENARSIVPYLLSVKQDQQQGKTNQEPVDYINPIELLKRAGYDAFIADTEKKKNSIRKYFRLGEALCTFGDSHRHEKYYIIHAVKENAENIKPKAKPERQDEYGTSVISIQIAKTGGFISIKNRYNHTVNNPDQTFDSNPDNIIPGLSYSLQKFFKVSFETSKVSVPENYIIINDQMVHYNCEVENVYFDENYYCQGSDITKIDKNKELVMDYFVLDKKQGVLLNPSNTEDGFVDAFNEEIKGKKIRTVKDKNTSETVILTIDEQKNQKEVARVLDGKITKLSLDTKTIGDNFLCHNKALREINLPNLQTAGDYFLQRNKALWKIDLPNLQKVGSDFLYSNGILREINLPNLQKVGEDFLRSNTDLRKIDLPNLHFVGSCFLASSSELREINLPNLQNVGNDFLANNKGLREINLPNLQKVDSGFLSNNTALWKIDLPNLQFAGSCFLASSSELREINLPNLQKVGSDFLANNKGLRKINLPNLQKVGWGFLYNNGILQEANLPKLQSVDDDFLANNKGLQKINLPNLKYVGRGFLRSNTALREINLPELQNVVFLYFQKEYRAFCPVDYVLTPERRAKIDSVIQLRKMQEKQQNEPTIKKHVKSVKEQLRVASRKIKQAMSAKTRQVIRGTTAHNTQKQ